MKQVDCHIFSAYLACKTVLQLIQQMPDTDSVNSLNDILETQLELFYCMIDGKHFGSDRLATFAEHLKYIEYEIRKIANECERE